MSKETTAADVWTVLEERYMAKSVPNHINLKQRLYGFKMKEGRSLSDNLDGFTKLIQDMENMQISIEGNEHFVDTLKYGRKTLDEKEVIVAIVAKDAEKSLSGKSSDGLGLTVRGFSREVGKGQEKQSDGDANVTLEGYESSEVLLETDRDNGVEWILDSSCTFHMSLMRSYFDIFEELDGGFVLMGNNAVYNVEGIGTIKLKLHDGVARTLSDVRYIPGLKRNLISLGTLNEHAYSYKAERGTLKVLKGSMVAVKASKKNGLYVLDGNVVQGEASVSVNEKVSDTTLWHRRIHHISEKRLIELSKQGLLCGHKVEKLDF
ncbi:uncharacterized protein LOC132803961 [Ziziphus jujuba]|uniref:Uncharacterized protein LOC132803961 n=1 Tax=Ziziphus jujuba TaxID=326968 RepID=A0ABM4AAP7_ZIZJJ|nr:uncharacterized protein LOC132803961 [Ziziphus jujuba]